MSSILTNTSAMTALQTLRGINSQLETTQNRISTGKSVSTAQDNAAYWSIATTMTSDTSTLGAVSTSLGLAKSQADTAANGVNSLVSLLKDYRDRLASSAQPGMDKEKIRTELDQLKNQMTTIVSSSSTNGVNWLNGSGLSSTTTNFDIISGLTRAGGSAGTSFSSISVSYKITPTSTPPVTPAAATVTGSVGSIAGTDLISTKFAANDLITINDTTIKVIAAGATPANTNEIAAGDTITNLLAKMTTALGTGGSASIVSGSIKLLGKDTSSDVTVSGLSAGFGIANGTYLATGSGRTVSSLVSGVTTALSSTSSKTSIESELTTVDNVLADLTKLGSIFGAASTRIQLQTEFTKNLTDTLQRGIGALVDADLDTESTRLKALQTQQQLAVQALSIANSNTQTILSLFRN